jgi:hypothetical protein
MYEFRMQADVNSLGGRFAIQSPDGKVIDITNDQAVKIAQHADGSYNYDLYAYVRSSSFKPAAYGIAIKSRYKKNLPSWF